MANRPAGWYQDPRDRSLQRWWDGGSWTAHTAPLIAPPVRGSGKKRGPNGCGVAVLVILGLMLIGGVASIMEGVKQAQNGKDQGFGLGGPSDPFEVVDAIDDQMGTSESCKSDVLEELTRLRTEPERAADMYVVPEKNVYFRAPAARTEGTIQIDFAEAPYPVSRDFSCYGGGVVVLSDYYGNAGDNWSSYNAAPDLTKMPAPQNDLAGQRACRTATEAFSRLDGSQSINNYWAQAAQLLAPAMRDLAQSSTPGASSILTEMELFYPTPGLRGPVAQLFNWCDQNGLR